MARLSPGEKPTWKTPSGGGAARKTPLNTAATPSEEEALTQFSKRHAILHFQKGGITLLGAFYERSFKSDQLGGAYALLFRTDEKQRPYLISFKGGKYFATESLDTPGKHVQSFEVRIELSGMAPLTKRQYATGGHFKKVSGG